MKVKIVCINKDNGNHANPHEAISHFGWIADGETQVKHSTRVQMVEFLEDKNKKNSAYVTGSDGKTAFCYVNVSVAGTRFLQTYADRDWHDNLLQLPECKH
jgi:hypothetical protein